MNIDKLLKEAYEEVKQEIADGTLKLGEAAEVKDKGASGISKEYGGGLRIFGTVNGEKRSAKLKKEEIQKWSTMTPQQKEDLYKNYLVTNFDPKADMSSKMKEDTVIKTPDGTLATATPLQKQQIQKTKDTVKTVKTGAVVMEEASDEPTDAEQEEPAEESGNISDKLSQLISQAIDSAGGVISSTEDKKMETALGKVIKNLTAAQDALSKVSEHETKLSEKVEAETTKNLEKYTKDFLKGLRKYTKDDALISKFRRTYDPLVAAAMKAEKPVDEIVKTAWGHFTLHEGRLNEENFPVTLDQYKASINKELDRLDSGDKIKQHIKTNSKSLVYIETSFKNKQTPEKTAGHIRDSWYGV